MALSYKLVLVCLSILCTSMSLTDAITVDLYSDRGTQSFAVEKIKFIDELKAKAAAEAFKIINDLAETSVAAGVDRSAANACKESYRIAFEILATCRRIFNDGLIKAQKLTTDHNIRAAIAVINNTFHRAIKSIFWDSTTLLALQGVAMEKVGELARDGMRGAMELLHTCGNYLLDNFDSVERVATMGTKFGGNLSDNALLGAYEVFNIGEDVSNQILINSAECAFEGLKAAVGKAPVREYAKSRFANVTILSPEAQHAADQLKAGFEEAINSNTKQPLIHVLKTIYYSFLSSIIDNANAIETARRTIDHAEKLIGQDPEIAISELHKEMTAVDNAVLAVSVDAVLGLGAAGEICGQDVPEKLKAAIACLSEGRENLHTDILHVEKQLVMGFKAGILEAQEGVLQARAGISAASKALFPYLVDAQQLAFKISKICQSV